MILSKAIVRGWSPTLVGATTGNISLEAFGSGQTNNQVAIYVKDLKAATSGLNFRVVGSFDGGTTWVGLTVLGAGATTGSSYALTAYSAIADDGSSFCAVFPAAPMIRIQTSAVNTSPAHSIDIYYAEI